MRGINSSSGWTHLLPGLIVAGIGAGLVNVPLASTAVGVVHPNRAGMASGINSTFRQVGIAAGVAALGSIFAARVRDGVVSHLAGTPLSHSAQSLAHAIGAGQATHVLATAPPAVRGQLAAASVSSFVAGLNDILLIAAVTAFCGAAISLIRQKDFHQTTDGKLADLRAPTPAVSESRLAA
jgi:hypothetical protein